MSPNIEELIESCKIQAKKMKLGCPDIEIIKSKIDEILFERDNYECALKGITTKDELTLLLLAHFHTLICNSNNLSEPVEACNLDGIRGKVNSALFNQNV